MSSVLLNVPRMSGISVCWECTTASIHVHSAHQRPDFYAWESYSDSPLWHYMPLEEGERIEECWYRSGPRGHLGALGVSRHPLQLVLQVVSNSLIRLSHRRGESRSSAPRGQAPARGA